MKHHISHHKHYCISSFTCFLLIFYSSCCCCFSCHCSLFSSASLPLALSPGLSVHSSSELTPRQAVQPRSTQLNYWEHKNAAANGSWINTLAKLLSWLLSAATGHGAENTGVEDAEIGGHGCGFVWSWATITTRSGHWKAFRAAAS